jgi:DNA-binding response OmpR family regulator
MFAMYQLRPFDDWPDTGIVGSRIFHLRRKLREAKIRDVRIETCKGFGACLQLGNGVQLDWFGTSADGAIT